jgi:hypothetical protein
VKNECSGASGVCSAEPAELSITTATRSALSGEIAMTNSHEVWSFEMGWPTATYLEPATFQLAVGQYSEELAELAIDAVISVDSGGRLFFQSAYSGCVGNGTLTPRSDGTFNVYDVALLLENCGDDVRNGEF